MWNSKKSITASFVACVLVLLAIVFIGVASPLLLDKYLSQRGVAITLKPILLSCYYPCASLGVVAIASLMKMLMLIKNDKPFCKENVKMLKIISWCCFGAAAICAVGGIWYFPFLFIFAAAAFVGLILRVVKNVMEKAVEIREENDLTV